MSLTYIDILAIALIFFTVFFCCSVIFIFLINKILKANIEIKETVQFFTENENERYEDLVKELKRLMDKD
jgi:hypothetical protein